MILQHLTTLAACFLVLTLCSIVASADDNAVSAVVAAYAHLKSEDGKHEIQVLAVRFGMTADEKKLLSPTTVMDSDPYWHHFHHRRILLRVGDKEVKSGPRILPPAQLPSEPAQTARGGYTVTFVVPADIKLKESPISFTYGKGEKPPSEPVNPFATLTWTEKESVAVTQPVRLSVRSVDALDEQTAAKYKATHLACVQTSSNLELEAVRFGKQESVGHSPVLTVNGKKRPLDASDSVFLFKALPDSKAQIALRVKNQKGWFPCDPWLASDRPAPPQVLK